MVCRGLLLRLESAGYIKLPPKKFTPNNPLADRKSPPKVDIDPTPIYTQLSEIQPLEIRQVRCTSFEKLFNSLIAQYHYLGYCHPVGEHLKYVVFAKGRAIACFAWSSAPRHIWCRDKFIGWLPPNRRGAERLYDSGKEPTVSKLLEYDAENEELKEKVAKNRGSHVLVDVLGKVYHGILCVDRWGAYTKYHKGLIQICWAHLKRDFLGILEIGQTTQSEDAISFAKTMENLRKRMMALWYRFKEREISRDELIKKSRPIRNAIKRCLRNSSNSRWVHKKWAK